MKPEIAIDESVIQAETRSRQRTLKLEKLLMRLGHWLFLAVVTFWYIFLLAPIVVIVVASFTSENYLSFPPPGYSLRWFEEALGMEWFRVSIVNSFFFALASTLLAVILGIMAARVLSRHNFKGRELLEYIFLSPLVVPAVVIGFALLNFFSAVGWRHPFANLIAGHVLITFPLILRYTWASMKGQDISLEEAAYSLGATPWTAFRRVVLPMIRPGVIAAAILSFTYSFNDVPVSFFLIGPGVSTLPVEMMSHIQYSADPTPAAISTIMVVITIFFFVLAERTVGLGVFTQQ